MLEGKVLVASSWNELVSEELKPAVRSLVKQVSAELVMEDFGP